MYILVYISIYEKHGKAVLKGWRRQYRRKAMAYRMYSRLSRKLGRELRLVESYGDGKQLIRIYEGGNRTAMIWLMDSETLMKAYVYAVEAVFHGR